MEEKKDGRTITQKSKAVLGDYRGEFRKIIWPSRKDLVKQTITVIITSLFIGVIIAVMDFAFGSGQQIFSNFVSSIGIG